MNGMANGKEPTSSGTALDCCESLDLLRLSMKLESGIFDSFAFGPTKLLNASSAHRYRVVVSSDWFYYHLFWHTESSCTNFNHRIARF